MDIKTYQVKLKELIEIFNGDYQKMSLPLLKGLDTIGSPSIKKYELDSIRLGFLDLFNNDAFLSLIDDLNVYLAFNLGYGELDASFFIKSEDKLIWVDFEEKTAQKGGNRTTIEKNLDDQIKDHSEEMLVNYNQKLSFLVIGYVDDKFFKAKWKDQQNAVCDYSFAEVVKKLQSSSSIKASDFIISEMQYISNIRETAKEISSGVYKFYKQTKTHSKEIDNLIASNQVIICEGAAGAGKTVISLDLFFNSQSHNQIKLLIVNKKFYFSAGLNQYYYNNRCFFGSDTFLQAVDKNTIAVIDEGQRLSLSTLDNIVNQAKCTVVFGDPKQSFYQSDNAMNSNDLLSHFQSMNITCQAVKLTQSCRYNKATHLMIEGITSLSQPKGGRQRCTKHDINYFFKIYHNKDCFLNDYINDNDKKMFIPISDRPKTKDFSFNGESFHLLANEDDIFAYPEQNNSFLRRRNNSVDEAI
jgi:hypothetical protein